MTTNLYCRANVEVMLTCSELEALFGTFVSMGLEPQSFRDGVLKCSGNNGLRANAEVYAFRRDGELNDVYVGVYSNSSEKTRKIKEVVEAFDSPRSWS